jgi:hypothetical protein
VVAPTDDPVRVQVFSALRDAGRLEVGRRAAHPPAEGGEVPLDQVGLAGRVHADGDVRFPHGEVEVGVVQQQDHRHLGVEGDEAVQARRQPSVAEARGARHLQPPRRACRWNNGTCSDSSKAWIWRDTADWLRFSVSPAWVKLPASATAWKTRSLSQSKGTVPA